MNLKIAIAMLFLTSLPLMSFADSECSGLAAKEFALTEDSVLNALKNACGNELGKNPEFKTWLSNSKATLNVSDRYLTYVKNEVLPRLKKKKRSQLDGDEIGALGFGTGFSKLVAEKYCALNTVALTCTKLNPTKISGDVMKIVAGKK